MYDIVPTTNQDETSFIYYSARVLILCSFGCQTIALSYFNIVRKHI